MGRLRDLINDTPRIKARLMNERPRWIEFCSALDVVGDTDLALDLPPYGFPGHPTVV